MHSTNSLSDTFKVDKVLTVRAILHIFAEPGKIEDVGEVLAKMPEIIDVYEVTGEYDIIATAKANDLHRLRSLCGTVKLVLPPLFLSLRGYAQLLPPLLSPLCSSTSSS